MVPAPLSLVLLALLLCGCSGAPVFDSSRVDGSLTPAAVVADPQYAAGRRVLWGGIILQTASHARGTRVELLAYPLDGRQRPQLHEAALGRFLLEQDGILDPAVYAAGRSLTLTGTVVRVETGRVGETEQACPVVGAARLHLWPAHSRSGETGVRFGGEIGFGF